MTKEPRRFGTIYTRSGSPYLWIRFRRDGREYRESTHSASRDVAERLLGTRASEIGDNRFVKPETRRTTFEHVADMIKADYRVNGRRSYDRLEDLLAHLARAFAGVRARAITADRLTRYVADRLAENAAAQTVKNELGALHRAFALAKRAKKVSEIPEFPEISVSNVRQGFFEAADLRALLPELPAPVRPLVEFLYLSGWRLGEAVELRWSQADFQAGMLRLEPGTTKNDDGRTFPFGVLPPLRLLLERQRAHTRRVERRLGAVIPWVFHGEEGRPVGDFHKAWRAAIARAAYQGEGALRTLVRPGLVDRIPHDLRRTAARNLVRAGVSEHTAMKLTGHKTRSVFDRYDIVNEQDLREGVEKLAALHSRRGTPGAQSAASGGSAR